MPTIQDVIRRLTITGKTEGITQATGELKSFAVAQETVGKSSLSMAGQLERLQKSLDAEYRAEQKVEAIQKTLAAARNQGLISIQRENELLTLAAEKYRVVGESAQVMGERLNTAKEFALGLVGGVGAGVAFAGLAELPSKIMETVHEAAGLTHVAEVIGITTDKLQELEYAGAQYHVGSEAMDTALEKFSKNLGIASTGAGELAKILKANHIAITGDFSQDFEHYADLIKKATNEEQRNLLTTAAFGKGAQEMGLLFSKGAEGIRDATRAAEENGSVLSGRQLQAAQALDTEFIAMQAQMQATFKDFAITTAPLVEGAMTAITGQVRDLKTAVDDVKFGNWLDALQKVSSLLAQIGGGMGGQSGVERALSGNNIVIRGGQKDIDKIERQDHAGSVVRSIRQSIEANSSPYVAPSTPDHTGDAQAKAIKSVTDSLKLQTAALTETNRQAFIDQQLSQAKVTDASKEGKAIEALAGKYYDQKAAIDAANQATQFFGSTITDAFTGIVDGSSNVVTSMLNIAKAIGDALIQSSLLGSGPLSQLLGTASSNGSPGGVLGTILSSIIHGATGSVGLGGGELGGYGSSYAVGGYTGSGGRYEPAGIVHRGEYVFDAPTVSRIGVPRLNAMRGYSSGGYVDDASSGGVTINFNHVGKSDIPDLNAWASKQLPTLIKKANRHGARVTL